MSMFLDLQYLLINSLWCVGFHVLMTYDFSIFHSLGNKLEFHLPEWIVKPMFTCPPCMASIHGLLFALPYYHLSVIVPIHLVCLCALNTLIVFALGSLNKYIYGN